MEPKTFYKSLKYVRERIVILIPALGVMFCLLLATPFCEIARPVDANDICDFYVSTLGKAGAVAVRVTFSADANETIILKPSGQRGIEEFFKSGLQVNFDIGAYSADSYALSIESANVLKAVAYKKSRLNIRYTISFRDDANGVSLRSVLNRGFLLITGQGYTIASGSSLFLIPRRSDGSSIFRKFRIRFSNLETNMDSFAPFSRKANHTYLCSEVGALEDNFMAWGKIRVRDVEEADGRFRVVNPHGEGVVASSDKKIASLLEEIRLLSYEGRKVLAGNLKNGEVCVLFLPATKDPQGETERVFPGRHSLAIPFAFAEKNPEHISSLGSAIFNIFAENSFLKKTTADADWFYEGAVRLYGLVIAVRAGLIDAGAAEEVLSNIYARYVSNPLSGKTTLVNRMESDEDGSFFSDKSTIALASIASRLLSQTGAKVDVDALIRSLGKRSPPSRNKSLSLVDIEESAENLTGKSWTRYLDRLVRRNSLIKFSEFSKLEIFAHRSDSFPGQRRLLSRGSGRGWLFLLISVLMILLIPLIFGFYVRRAVKLDISMPAILPEDDEED